MDEVMDVQRYCILPVEDNLGDQGRIGSETNKNQGQNGIGVG